MAVTLKNIKMGGYELLSSISLIQINNEKIDFDLPDEVEGDLHVSVVFRSDENTNQPYFELNAISSFELEMVFVNVGKSGSVRNEPIPIGTYQKDFDLFFNFSGKGLESTSKHEITLNFFIKKHGNTTK